MRLVASCIAMHVFMVGVHDRSVSCIAPHLRSRNKHVATNSIKQRVEKNKKNTHTPHPHCAFFLNVSTVHSFFFAERIDVNLIPPPRHTVAKHVGPIND